MKILFKLLFTALALGAVVSNLHAQSVTAPDECIRTPAFPTGTVGAMCSLGMVPNAILTESFDEGIGAFTIDPVEGSGTNDIIMSTNGDTPSAGTGPETTASCTGSSNKGEFAFLEGSSTLAGESHCMSRSVDLQSYESGPLALSLWYHMFGRNIGELSVKVNGSPEFAISGQQQVANGQAWRQAVINLDDHAGSIVDLQVCMTEGDGSVSTFESDIAVDQVQVYGCGPEQFDLLSFMPAILATVETLPPPPPPPARWRITNEVVCTATFQSDWTVSDGVTSRKSHVSGPFDDPDTSDYVTVEPGSRTFRGTLRTSSVIGTCGTFVDNFTKTLKSNHDYRFILRPNSAGTDTVVITVVTER